MPFETPILAAVPAVFNFAVKGTQTTFELQQVPEQTRALFETIESTRSDIINARERRVALAKQYGSNDFAEWDRSVRDTEAALTDLEKLVESARIDLQHNHGKIGMKTRFTWVLRDSKSLSATSHRLTLAHQRMLFAMTIVHIKHDRERTDDYYHHGTGPAPPPYANPNNILRKLSDVRRSADQQRLAKSRSTASATEDEVHTRPPPMSRRTVIPALGYEEDSNDLFNQQRRALSTPSAGSLNPLVTAAEALNIDDAHNSSSGSKPTTQTISAMPARPAISRPSRPFVDTARLQTAQVENTEPLQHIIVSPSITPPDSPYPRPADAPFLNTSGISSTVEEQVRVVSAAVLGHRPALDETASIRFELDAAQEIRASDALEPPQRIPRKPPPVPGAQSIGRTPTELHIPTSRARETLVLPYPNDDPPERNPLRLLPQRITPTTDPAPSASAKSTSSSKSTPHFFAGHLQPVNIRWKLESEPSNASQIKSAKRPEAPPRPPKISHHDPAREYKYQPYRPT